jgi:hypothetical protein
LEVYAARETARILQGKVATLIGYWTGILPLSLADLQLHIPIAESLSEDQPDVVVAAIKVYNNQVESSIQEGIKLTSGVVKKRDDESNAPAAVGDDNHPVVPPLDDLRGSICRGGNDLRSLLIRYFCEALVDCAHHNNIREDAKAWTLLDKGYNVQAIIHPRLVPYNYVEGDPSIKHFLNHDGTLLLPFIIKALRKVPLGLKSLGGVMDHLVNRGHQSAPFVEGLKVELLPFQLQSLQWALERESIAGGIQSYFIAKIPRNDLTEDMYYNPIAGRLSTMAPKLVRGGIIAEQMVSNGGVRHDHVVLSDILFAGLGQDRNLAGADFEESVSADTRARQFCVGN